MVPTGLRTQLDEVLAHGLSEGGGVYQGAGASAPSSLQGTVKGTVKRGHGDRVVLGLAERTGSVEAGLRFTSSRAVAVVLRGSRCFPWRRVALYARAPRRQERGALEGWRRR